jgi:hypothetical protein
MRLAVIVGIVLLGGGIVAAAAEGGAAAGASKTSQLVTQSKVEIGDLPGHELTQAVGEEEIKTPDRIADVSFDDAKAKVVRQADLVDGSGTVRGYATWDAPSGQKLFVMFGYTIPPFPAGQDRVSFEGTFEWIGGTGTLQHVQGKGTVEGEISRSGEARYRWAGSYELNEK